MPRRGSQEKQQDHKKVLEQWTERDLTAAALAGELPAAFEVDDLLQQVCDVLASGRHPVLVGESGVGKSAIIYELIRRSIAGNGPPGLEGRRVLQFSFRHRASALKEPSLMRPEMQKLMEALDEAGQEIVPFFRDFHLAFRFDLEAQLEAVGFRFAGPVLGEGEHSSTLSMLEYSPELDQHYVLLNVEEPSYDRASRILQLWAKEQERLNGRKIMQEALDEVLHLSHRFLARSHLPRKALELLGQVASLIPPPEPVTDTAIIERFCRNHRVPRALVDPAIPMDLEELEGRFAAQVLGQTEAVKAVVQMIGLIKAGLSDVRRPFGVFLFVGPTGVGKTHVAQLLAEYLFGSRERMVRFNMADYQKESDPEVLFGNPEAGALPLRRGVITQRVAGHPFAVLLLDEFEKAHVKVHDRFLQLFDEGQFINGASELVSCRSMIVIATSNAGAEVYRGAALGFNTLTDVDSLTRELDRRLSQHFRFEFLNRFDQIVHFHPLTREHIRTIALRELEQLRERAGLKRRGFSLEVDDAVLDWLASHGYDPNYGARFLRRTIERHVTTSLAEVMVAARPGTTQRIELTVSHSRICAKRIERQPAQPRREAVILPLGRGEQVRTLDRHSLLQESAELLKSAERRLNELEQKKEEASRLLERMNEEGFWDRQAESREVLEQYRDLDVSIQVGERLAAPILHLTAAREEVLDGGAINLTEASRALEKAAHALREWDERLAEEGAGKLWMVLQKVDPLLPAGRWLIDLTAMELAWCRKLGVAAAVVGYELMESNELSRVVLEVEGPGAGPWLAMEVGIHRLRRSQGSDLRARIDLIPESPRHAAHWSAIGAIKKQKGLFELEVACRGRVELPERGLVMEFLGENQDVLGPMLYDLYRHWKSAPNVIPEVARIYGQDGSGARDPRTGVVTSRLKDVMKGDLDRFLEGWRHSGRANPGTQQ